VKRNNSIFDILREKSLAYQKKNIEIFLRELTKDLKNMYQIKRHEKLERIIYNFSY
jgi:hypothetical protein